MTSPSSATTARGSTGRSPPRSAWAAFPCRSTTTRPRRRWCSSFQNAEIAFAIVEDQEQVDKLLEILPQCPRLEHIYFDDARGLRHYTQPEARELREPAGERPRVRRRHPDFFLAEIEQGPAVRHRGDVLHLGHHRPAEGRGAHPRRTSSPPPGWAPRWKASRPTRRCSRTCRPRGSGRTSSPTRSPTSWASASPAPSRPKR